MPPIEYVHMQAHTLRLARTHARMQAAKLPHAYTRTGLAFARTNVFGECVAGQSIAYSTSASHKMESFLPIKETESFIFGQYDLPSWEVFLKTRLTYCCVNLKPVVPGKQLTGIKTVNPTPGPETKRTPFTKFRTRPSLSTAACSAVQ